MAAAEFLGHPVYSYPSVNTVLDVDMLLYFAATYCRFQLFIGNCWVQCFSCRIVAVKKKIMPHSFTCGQCTGSLPLITNRRELLVRF